MDTFDLEEGGGSAGDDTKERSPQELSEEFQKKIIDCFHELKLTNLQEVGALTYLGIKVKLFEDYAGANDYLEHHGITESIINELDKLFKALNIDNNNPCQIEAIHAVITNLHYSAVFASMPTTRVHGVLAG